MIPSSMASCEKNGHSRSEGRGYEIFSCPLSLLMIDQMHFAYSKVPSKKRAALLAVFCNYSNYVVK